MAKDRMLGYRFPPQPRGATQEEDMPATTDSLIAGILDARTRHDEERADALIRRWRRQPKAVREAALVDAIRLTGELK